MVDESCFLKAHSRAREVEKQFVISIYVNILLDTSPFLRHHARDRLKYYKYK